MEMFRRTAFIVECIFKNEYAVLIWKCHFEFDHADAHPAMIAELIIPGGD
jgi:hypothetical protein